MKNTHYIIFLLLTIWSCNKTAETVSPAQTKTDLITKNSWMMDKYSISTISKSINIYVKGGANNLVNYEKYRVTFSKNGELTIVDENGASKTGTWKFINNETQIQTSSHILNIDLLENAKLTVSENTKKADTPAAEWKTYLDFLISQNFSTATEAFNRIQTLVPIAN